MHEGPMLLVVGLSGVGCPGQLDGCPGSAMMGKVIRILLVLFGVVMVVVL